MKRVFLVHGWDGAPDGGWFPWLSQELAAKEFAVTAVPLPDPSTPRIEAWIPAIATAVGTPDADTYFVAHSMGCQAIARYLAGAPEGVRVGGVVYVAGFFSRLTNLEGSDEESIARPWLTEPIDFRRLALVAPKSIAIFSDNDKYVPLDNAELFRESLGAKIVRESGKGHYSFSDTFELPAARDALLELAQ